MIICHFRLDYQKVGNKNGIWTSNNFRQKPLKIDSLEALIVYLAVNLGRIWV